MRVLYPLHSFLRGQPGIHNAVDQSQWTKRWIFHGVNDAHGIGDTSPVLLPQRVCETRTHLIVAPPGRTCPHREGFYIFSLAFGLITGRDCLFWRYCSESADISLCCYALACGLNMPALFELFARNIICDVMIGWRCWGEWQFCTLCYPYDASHMRSDSSCVLLSSD